MKNYQAILDDVCDYKEFLTVEEMDASTLQLQKDYPELVEVSVAGYSRANHPIYCLKIGSGEKNALLFGCPHPNEPIGAMMLEYFSRALCEHQDYLRESNYTWYIIKCIDIDGTKLNEGWFKGPFNITNYARNFFRPTSYEQVEWTFPIHYKEYSFENPMPETKALMKLMDEIKPDFMYSLHNAGFGGAYWYLSDDIPELYPQFYHAAQGRGVPLSLGEAEAPFIQQYAPAVFKNEGLEAEYDYLEKFSEDKTKVASRFECGTSSDGYASRYGTHSLLTELPYFYSPKIESDIPMSWTRKEVKMKSAAMEKEEYLSIKKEYEAYQSMVSDDNPFTKMIEMMVKDRDETYQETLNFVNDNESYLQICKESEYFDCMDVSRVYRLLMWGMLVRGAKFERAKRMDDTVHVWDSIIERLETIFAEKAEAVEQISYSVVPIQTLVRIQLESGLLMASYIEKKGEEL